MIAAAQARACSMIAEWVRPSNFELVQLSDAIVVATAVEGRPDEFMGRTVFQVAERVKGDSPGRVELPGTLGSPEPSDLTNITYSHPEGHMGPCNRMTFRKGGRYLLFLERDADGELRQTSEAFSRINEDYVGEDNAWMRTVRRYVRVQAMGVPTDQISILERMLRTRRGPAGEALGPVDVADIRDHLSSLSPYKPTSYLLGAYAALERGKPPDHGVRSRDADAEQSSAAELSHALLGERKAREKGGLEAQRVRVLTALVRGDHPQARPLFDRLAEKAPDDPATMGLVLRFLAKHGSYDRAFNWIETRLMSLLAKLDSADARRLIGNVAAVQRGEDSEEGKERWRSDPRASSIWPEMALSLYWYQVGRFGADNSNGFSDAVETLSPADYRARPLLTLALAANYTEGIAEWAKVELYDDEKRQDWEKLSEAVKASSTDPAQLPLRILLSSWEDKHGAVLEQVFCQSGPRRLLLFREIGEFGDNLYGWLLHNIAASHLTRDERAGLRHAMTRWQANRRKEEGDGDEAVADLLKGGPSKGKPITCLSRPG